MSFYEYIVNFDKVKRDPDCMFLVSENSYYDYKIGDIVVIRDNPFTDIIYNTFVIICDSNIAVPVEFLFYLLSDHDTYMNIDFVYQIDYRKVINRIGKIDMDFVSKYKKKYILLNKR